MTSVKHNYIYLLQLREFYNMKQPIYKLGKTHQEGLKRFQNYPKGSVLIYQSICGNCDYLEKIIIKFFKLKYIQKTDYGLEYFEGNYVDMKNDINIIIMHDDKKTHQSNINDRNSEIIKTYEVLNKMNKTK
jgi:hypothetical protein